MDTVKSDPETDHLADATSYVLDAIRTGRFIEALRGEATPDGWDPTSGGAYCRELWVDSAAAALEINAALAGAESPQVERALATWTVCLWLCSAPIDEPRLLGMRVDADGMDLDVDHVGARLLAASFRDSLERLGAENYVELRFTSRTDPPLPMLVTIQRIDGKTPHELRRQAEAKLGRFAVYSGAVSREFHLDRIAALEAEIASLRERWTNSLTTDGHAYRRAVDEAEMVGAELRRVDAERDAALARVAELEEEMAVAETQSGIRLSRALAAESRVAELETAVATPEECARVFANGEASIRADERARTERDIVAMLHRSRDAERAVSPADKAMRTQYMCHRTGGALDMIEVIARVVGDSDYPRLDAPAPKGGD